MSVEEEWCGGALLVAPRCTMYAALPPAATTAAQQRGARQRVAVSLPAWWTTATTGCGRRSPVIEQHTRTRFKRGAKLGVV